MARRLATVDFPVLYMDFATHRCTFSTIFKWIDTAQSVLYDAPAQSASRMQALEHMKHLWANHAVMRTNAAKILVPFEELRSCTHVRVQPALRRIGRTSWGCSFSIMDSKREGSILAVAETTMVNTDPETHTKSTPLPYVEELRKLRKIRALSFDLPNTSVSVTPPDHGTLVGEIAMITRATDCDGLGHINNALYATLAEEMRASIAHSGNLVHL